MEKEKILEEVRELMTRYQAPLCLLVWYGRRDGNDIDLLAVLELQALFDNLHHEKLDITVIGWGDFRYMIERQDPAMSEPFLTGEVIFSSVTTDFQDKVRSNPIHAETPVYLCRCAKLFLGWARGYWEQKNYPAAANACRFAASYLVYARHYWSGGRILPLRELRSKRPCSLLEDAEDLFKGRKEMDGEDLADLLEQIAIFLRESSRLVAHAPAYTEASAS